MNRDSTTSMSLRNDEQIFIYFNLNTLQQIHELTIINN